MQALGTITYWLVIIGALNWGLVGLFGFDLVAALFGLTFGERSPITSVIYALVGLSALLQLVLPGARYVQPRAQVATR